MMHPTTLPGYSNSVGRFFGSAALLILLVGVVFLPLCSALSLCTLPCCHHAAAPEVSATNTACCTISRSDTSKDALTVSAAATQPGALDTARTAAWLTFAPAPNPPVAAERATHLFRSLDHPIHILNSVFLI